MSETKAKVFVWVTRRWSDGDMHCSAIAEDGTALGGHLSSNEGFARHDMGVTSDWKHEGYRAHYPAGFEVVWVADPASSVEFNVAYEAHKAKYPDPAEVSP